MFKIHNIIVIMFLLVAIYFRFYNLGYSDFQGDEAKIFIYKTLDKDFISTLFTNSKGPGQYIVVYLTDIVYGIVEINFDKEYFFRIPFALVGVISVFLFYYLGKMFGGKNAGVHACIFASLNGFFIAFSRIVQYQSFNIFLALVSSIFFIGYLKNKSIRNLFLVGLISAFGFLFHYDAVFYIVPQFIVLLFLLDKKIFIKNISAYFLGMSFLLFFFLPYFFSSTFSSTLDYILNERSIGFFSYDSVYYSFKLMSIYFPKEFIIFVIFVLFTIFVFWYKKNQNKTLLFLVFSMIALVCIRYLNISPRRIFILPSILVGILTIILYIKKDIKSSLLNLYLFLWVSISFVVLFLFLNKPLTHIYNIFIPLTFMIAIGFDKLNLRYIKYSAFIITIVSLLSFNYVAYIENKSEYPWNKKQYIFGNMYTGIAEGEIVRGIFGFPYYRNLDGLRESILMIMKENESPFFYSNIKNSRLQYYVNNEVLINKKDIVPIYIEIKNSIDYEGNYPPSDVVLDKVLETPMYSIYKGSIN